MECRGLCSRALPRSRLYTLADLPGLCQRSVAPELQASKLWWLHRLVIGSDCADLSYYRLHSCALGNAIINYLYVLKV